MIADPSMLTQLRAFEAVGRNRSFAEAAAELGVAPTGLSHHVRHLEATLGVELLERLHRRIALTAPGAELLDACSRSFDILNRAVGNLQKPGQDAALTVSVAPYFSAKWLAPRLGNFWSDHPEIELRLHHAYQPADFHLNNADAGIGWSAKPGPQVEAIRVVRGDLIAVCNPEIASQLESAASPADLCRWKLLHEFREQHWEEWFHQAGSPLPETARLVQVDDSHALRKMVMEGQGVALFFADLSREDLRLGQLVQPFEGRIDTGCSYYMTRPRDRPMSRPLRFFWDWIIDEISLDPFA